MMVERVGRFLIVRFDETVRGLSWAITGGGFCHTRLVAWFHVRYEELGPGRDAAHLMRTRLREEGLSGAVGLMTAAYLDGYEDVQASEGQTLVRSIATVGLSNALAIGDPPTAHNGAGTVNLLCHIHVPLSRGAMVEALSLATEARTAAFMETGVKSTCSGRGATGTGTDCIVITAPLGRGGERYVGKHTPIGSLVGRTVKEAVLRGIQARLHG